MLTNLSDIPAGPTLDALVAKARGMSVYADEGILRTDDYGYGTLIGQSDSDYESRNYSPSTDKAQAFELIEEFGISVAWDFHGWSAFVEKARNGSYASTPQEAICKAVVASAYGNEVDVGKVLK